MPRANVYRLGRHNANTGPSHTATKRGLTGRRAAARKTFSPRPTAQASEREAEAAARGSVPLSQASRKSFSSSVVSSFTCRTSFSASSLLGEAEADGFALWYRAAMAPAPPGPSARGRGEAGQQGDPQRPPRERGGGNRHRRPAGQGTVGRPLPAAPRRLRWRPRLAGRRAGRSASLGCVSAALAPGPRAAQCASRLSLSPRSV